MRGHTLDFSQDCPVKPSKSVEVSSPAASSGAPQDKSPMEVTCCWAELEQEG